MRRLFILPTAIAVAGAVAIARRYTARPAPDRSTARSPIAANRTVSRSGLPRSRRSDQRTEDGTSVVDEWMRGSFPASDPPQSW